MSERENYCRLDKLVRQQFGLTRSQALAWIEQGLIFLNGRKLSLADKGKMLPEDSILERPGEEQLIAESQPIDVLYASDDLWIVNKPAGIPVHPLKPRETGTLLNYIFAHDPNIINVGKEGELRSGVVHRLDTTTSGAIAFARTSECWEQLRQAFSEHRAEKLYLALVEGDATNIAGNHIAWLTVARHREALVQVVEAKQPNSRRCHMAIEPLACSEHASLIQVRLDTGFLHQIRVICSHLGHPLLGDCRYGGPPAAPRPMLHAWQLTLPHHPMISAPLPDDFTQWLQLHKLYWPH